MQRKIETQKKKKRSFSTLERMEENLIPGIASFHDAFHSSSRSLPHIS